jgi:hypothetical protein
MFPCFFSSSYIFILVLCLNWTLLFHIGPTPAPQEVPPAAQLRSPGPALVQAGAGAAPRPGEGCRGHLRAALGAQDGARVRHAAAGGGDGMMGALDFWTSGRTRTSYIIISYHIISYKNH